MSAADVTDGMGIEEFVDLMVLKSEKDAAREVWLGVLRDQEHISNVGELRKRVPTLNSIDGLSIFAQAYICDLLNVSAPATEAEASSNKKVKLGFADRLAHRAENEYTNSEVVIVEALSGKDLAPKDFFSGMSDPYLLFGLVDSEEEEFHWPTGLGQQYFQTRIVRKSLNPAWNCVPIEFVKKVARSGELSKKFLRIECWDYNIAMRHDFMGKVTFPVNRIDRFAPGIEIEPKWLQLEGRPNRGDVVSGIVQLRMTYLDLEGYNGLTSCMMNDRVRSVWHAARAAIDKAQASYLGLKYAGIPEERCTAEDLVLGHYPTQFARRNSTAGDSCSSGVDIVGDDEGEEEVVVEEMGASTSQAAPSGKVLSALVAPRGGGFYGLCRFDNFIDRIKDEEEAMLANPLDKTRPFLVDVTATLRLESCKADARWTPPTVDDMEPPEIARCVACVVENAIGGGKTMRYDLVVFDYTSIMVAHLHTARDATGAYVWAPRTHVKFFTTHRFDGPYEARLREPDYVIQPVDVEKLKNRSLFACPLTDLVMIKESIVPV